ncbi:hypothetical protein [Euzebya tangerina]|uniref:hypothetical protein n=1 Tax=Euzebya tangerina TaxID=591198 RepID=UPI000E320886|nr:hypothetical protein [Euzebya tangerina]
MTTDLQTDQPPIGTECTREEVLAIAGSRTRRAAVLRAAGGGPIVGLALTLARNPRAPQVMVVGSGERPAREAREIVEAAAPIPVWVRAGSSGTWRYCGPFVPTRFDTTARGRASAAAVSDEAVGVVRLTPAEA